MGRGKTGLTQRIELVMKAVTYLTVLAEAISIATDASCLPADERICLITDGIFRFSRNPAFLGFDLVYAGITLMFFNVPLLDISIFAGTMLHIQIVKNEEPFCRKAFGDEYERYFGA